MRGREVILCWACDPEAGKISGGRWGTEQAAAESVESRFVAVGGEGCDKTPRFRFLAPRQNLWALIDLSSGSPKGGPPRPSSPPHRPSVG